MRVLSLFSGIGAYERALKNIGIDVDIVNYCEILKEKSKAYSILHNVSEELNLQDVTKVNPDELEDFDLLTYSTPCQSFSLAGKMQGLEDFRGTLFYSALKIIEKKKPKYCIMENVSNLAGKRFKNDFQAMLDALDLVGYNNYWKIINAQDFIPQSRSRVYVVSIRKDIDNYNFIFPQGEDTRNWWDIIDLKDMRPLTDRQQKKINYALGLDNGEYIKIEGEVNLEHSVITLRMSGLRFQNNRVYPTIPAYYGKGGGNFSMIAYGGKVLGGITPKNCLKLMGFEFEDGEKLSQAGFKRQSQYVMAGDSVCVPVLEAIFKNLFLI